MFRIKNNKRFRSLVERITLSTLTAFIMWLSLMTPAHADSLYISDGGDNSVKQFDAESGAFLGFFVKKSLAGLHGPRSLVFNPDGNLIVVDQNVNTAAHGDILLFSGQTRKLLDFLVSNGDRNAPAIPLSLVLSDGHLFVADLSTETNPKSPLTPGRIMEYTSTGEFVKAITPPVPYLSSFHPRSVVIGPDNLLYVSSAPSLPLPPALGLGGQVLRFNSDGTFKDVFINDVNTSGDSDHLNRPQGLVFSPEGDKIFITSFRASTADTDSIRIYNSIDGTFDSKIDLDVAGEARTFAQTILFGPKGCLFVPINNTGEVRKYNVGIDSCDSSLQYGEYDSFVGVGGDSLSPWSLTFGNTAPDTLQYYPE